MIDPNVLHNARVKMHENNKANRMSMWTVYDHPSDYPDKFVARLFTIDAAGAVPTGSIIITPDLDTLRDLLCFELHLSCLTRSPEDDAKIVETWL